MVNRYAIVYRPFDVVEDDNCPLYEVGECFRLTAKAFSPPDKKAACLILVREMT